MAISSRVTSAGSSVTIRKGVSTVDTSDNEIPCCGLSRTTPMLRPPDRSLWKAYASLRLERNAWTTQEG